MGEATLKLEYFDKKFSHTFLFVDDDNASLLGRDLCAQLKFELQIASSNINSINNDV